MENPLPTLPQPELTPQRVSSHIPQIGGDALQHVGRYANAVVMACFEQLGGLAMMVDWASQNRSDFYTKLFPKIMQRSTQLDVTGSVTIDDAISRLESRPLLAEYTDVYDL